MDEEPAAPTTEYDARGPHLPDWMTRLGFWPWVFIIAAAAQVIYRWRSADLGVSTPTIFILVLDAMPSVLGILFPAALLGRHPDAWDRARALTFGTLLFASIALFRFIENQLTQVFVDLSPPTEELPISVLAAAFGAFVGVISIFAVAYVAIGLSNARRFEDVPVQRWVLVFVTLAVVAIAALRIYGVTQVQLGGLSWTPPIIAYFAAFLIIGILSAAAWGFLLVVCLRGRSAGEEPGAGWAAAGVGAALVIAQLLITSVASLTLRFETEDMVLLYSILTSGLLALAYLALLVGFALGLPDLTPIEYEDEDDLGDEPDLDDQLEPVEAMITPA